MTGSHEARGSIPLSSTSEINLGLAKAGPFFDLHLNLLDFRFHLIFTGIPATVSTTLSAIAANF